MRVEKVQRLKDLIQRFVADDRLGPLIPGVTDYGSFIVLMEIQECTHFPWPLRAVFRRCIEFMEPFWLKFAKKDSKSFCVALEMEKRMPRSTFYNSSEMIFGENPTPIGKQCFAAYETVKHASNFVYSSFKAKEETDEAKNKSPVFLRDQKMSGRKLAEAATKEYLDVPQGPSKKIIIRKEPREEGPGWLRPSIRKGGVVFKRPTIRPSHLVDCLRDPVHFEFFQRFAKTFHFDKQVKFYKKVDEIKSIRDTKTRSSKIMELHKEYFSETSASLGVDGEIIKELLESPVDEVTLGMLISAQACVMKSMEQTWGEKYLQSFPETKREKKKVKNQEADLVVEFGKNLPTESRMGNKWRTFYTFIKRSARFLKAMKNPEIKTEFIRYLRTVGRDPTRYHLEKWSEISAVSIDSSVNNEVMYHRRTILDKPIIAELLVNDLNFLREVSCYSAMYDRVKFMKSIGKGNSKDSELLVTKAKSIVDIFLNSAIPPKVRVNAKPDVAAQIILLAREPNPGRAVFHDISIQLFPVMAQFWKMFCFLRYQFIPRKVLKERRNEMVKERAAEILQKKKKKSDCLKIEHENTAPLIDYTKTKHYKEPRMDVLKTLDDVSQLTFSLSAGARMVIPIRSRQKIEGSRAGSVF